MAWPTTRASDCVATLPSSLETASTGNSTRPSVPVTSFSTRTISPGATRYCFPPARITAYIRLPPSNVVEIQPVYRNPRAHTGATKGPAVLPVFSATALQQPRQASPERVGQYRQTPLF